MLDKPFKKCYNINVNKNKSQSKKEVLFMEKKMTKKEMFAMIMELAEVKGNEEMTDFLAHEIELLNKKSSKSGQSRTQKENENILLAILDALEMVGKPVTITELQAKVPAMAEYSNQKLSALLKKLVEGGSVIKTIDKKKSYFSLYSEEEEVEVEE